MQVLPIERVGGSVLQTIVSRKMPLTTARKNAASFTRQMQVMTLRTIIITYRDPMGMSVAAMQATLMGLRIGWIFLRLGRDQTGIRSREGFLYISPALEGYLFLVFEIYRLSVDITVFN